MSTKFSKLSKFLTLILSLMIIVSICTISSISSYAATSTGVGLSAHALKAYNEDWDYVWGGSSPGAVDCSGLIWSYNGVGGIRVDMLAASSESGYVSNGVPRIHGLGLHRTGHVGVYIGGGMVVDARDSNSDMCYGSLDSSNWTSWFKVAGVSYPTNGWVKFNGDSFYYQNGQYVINTTKTIDGVTYTFGSDGVSDKHPPEEDYKATDYTTSNDTGSSSSSSSSNSTNSSSVLKIGSSGSKVEKLQERLHDLGYYNGEITGYFGEDTESAVIAFQKKANLTADGVVGSTTSDAIYADDAPEKAKAKAVEETQPPTEPLTEAPTELPLEDQLKPGGEGSKVKQLQTRLTELGYYSEEVTGKFDKNTEVALTSYYIASQLQPINSMDEEGFDLLLSEDAVSSDEYSVMTMDYSGYSVTALQSSLIKLGYLSSEDATGVIDEKTISAVKMAQANFALEPTGEIDEVFMNALLMQTTQEDMPVIEKTDVNIDNALVAANINQFEAVPNNSNIGKDNNLYIIIASVMIVLCVFALFVYLKNNKTKKQKSKAVRINSKID